AEADTPSAAPTTTASAASSASHSRPVRSEEAAVDVPVQILENIEDHPFDGSRLPVQKLPDRFHGDLSCLLIGKMEFPRGNAAEGHGPEAVLRRQLQAGAV